MSPQSPVTCRDRNSIAFCPAFWSAVSAPGVATSWPRSNNGCLVVGCMKKAPFGGFGSCVSRGAARKRRRKRKRPSCEGKAPVRPRCQGRQGLAFIGAQRRPLTEEADGSGARFAQEGQ